MVAQPTPPLPYSRSRWSMPGGFDHEIEICYWAASARRVGDRVPVGEVELLLARWLAGPASRRTLRRIYASLRGPELDESGRWDAQRIHEDLRAALLLAFQRGELVALRKRQRHEAPGAPPSKPPPSKRPKSVPPPPKRKSLPKTDTFIALRIVDQEGNPMAGEFYRVTVPGGAMRTGHVDKDGFVLIDDIEAGTCEVELPQVDGREWDAGAG